MIKSISIYCNLLHARYCRSNGKAEVTPTLVRRRIKKYKFHTCNTCGKSFSASFCLRRHEMIHRGNKPYKCEYCPKTSMEKQHLTYHERIDRTRLELAEWPSHNTKHCANINTSFLDSIYFLTLDKLFTVIVFKHNFNFRICSFRI